MDLLFWDNFSKTNEYGIKLAFDQIDGWDEVERQKDEIVEESLQDPEFLEIYLKLVRNDITFEEFVKEKRAYEDRKYAEEMKNSAVQEQ